MIIEKPWHEIEKRITRIDVLLVINFIATVIGVIKAFTS